MKACGRLDPPPGANPEQTDRAISSMGTRYAGHSTFVAAGTAAGSEVRVAVPFFVPIYAAQLDGFRDRADSLVAGVLRLRDTAPGVRKSNRGPSWHSATDLHRTKDAALQWLFNAARAIACHCATQCRGEDEDIDLQFVDAWANVLNLGGWHSPHNHFGADWSGVCYLRTGEAPLTDTVDEGAGTIEFLSPLQPALAFGLAPTVRFSPADGLMLLFPSALVHLVHPHASIGERISIAFNLRDAGLRTQPRQQD